MSFLCLNIIGDVQSSLKTSAASFFSKNYKIPADCEQSLSPISCRNSTHSCSSHWSFSEDSDFSSTWSFSENELENDGDLKWIPCSNDVSLPPYAVVGGNDVDGDVIYVGRAHHDGNTLVAKVIPAKMRAYVCWMGAEIAVPRFEVLCSQHCVWKHCYNHQIPHNAVVCGHTALGKSVYIGRGNYKDSLTVGRISAVHRSLFIPFECVERRLETYDILLLEGHHHDHYEEKPNIYPNMPVPLPMPMPMPQPMPVPYLPTAPPSETPYPRPKPNFIPAGTYRPQTPMMVTPVTVYNPSMPTTTTTTTTGTTDTWVTAAGNYVPSGAVVGGNDCDGTVLYVCRVMHEGYYILGRAAPERGCCYISHHGQELIRSNYEILVHSEKYHWVPSTGNYFPPAAVIGGRLHNNEPLFVGRGTYQGAQTCGYVKRSDNCLHISYGGHGHRLYTFELLVHTANFHKSLSY